MPWSDTGQQLNPPTTVDKITDAGGTGKAILRLTGDVSGGAVPRTVGDGTVEFAPLPSFTEFGTSIATAADRTAALNLLGTGRTASNYLRGDGTWATPTNTTYTGMTLAEAQAGTGGTTRTITPTVLVQAVRHHVTGDYTKAVSAIGQALAGAADQAAARAAIGAGTGNSNLTLGTTGSTALAGNTTAAQIGGVTAGRAGATLWFGTQAEYDALPTATRNAAGFVAVIA